MKTNGIHVALRSRTQKQLEDAQRQLDEANERLSEAVKLGDLSENAEYDAAKEEVRRYQSKVEELRPVLQMPTISARDAVPTITPGCIIRLRVFQVTEKPMNPRSKEFLRMVKEEEPQFEGELIYGGALTAHTLMGDCVLSEKTPIGAEILGKEPGGMSIRVPSGFANIVVEKLKLSDCKDNDFYVHYHGDVGEV